MAASNTRNEIIRIADELIYHQGFEHTSFADIAGAVKISRGNFYHHFKSKDEILDAVIELRIEKTKALLQSWSEAGDSPLTRIESFIEMIVMNASDIKKFGCPVGSLCTELSKLKHPSRASANGVFSVFQKWLAEQFREAGHRAKSDTLAMHLLGRSQGIATLANAFRDEDFLRDEVKILKEWLRAHQF